MVLVVIRTCDDCGHVYRRPASNHDEVQDLRDGMRKTTLATAGHCDDCWRAQIIRMLEPR